MDNQRHHPNGSIHRVSVYQGYASELVKIHSIYASTADWQSIDTSLTTTVHRRLGTIAHNQHLYALFRIQHTSKHAINKWLAVLSCNETLFYPALTGVECIEQLGANTRISQWAQSLCVDTMLQHLSYRTPDASHAILLCVSIPMHEDTPAYLRPDPDVQRSGSQLLLVDIKQQANGHADVVVASWSPATGEELGIQHCKQLVKNVEEWLDGHAAPPRIRWYSSRHIELAEQSYAIDTESFSSNYRVFAGMEKTPDEDDVDTVLCKQLKGAQVGWNHATTEFGSIEYSVDTLHGEQVAFSASLLVNGQEDVDAHCSTHLLKSVDDALIFSIQHTASLSDTDFIALTIRKNDWKSVQVNGMTLLPMHESLLDATVPVMPPKPEPKPVDSNRSVKAVFPLPSALESARTRCATLFQLPEESWSLVAQKDNVHVAKHNPKGQTVDILRAKYTFHEWDMFHVLSIIDNMECRKMWDPMFETGKWLRDIVPGVKLGYMQTKSIWPMTTREFVMYQGVFAHDDQLTIVAASPSASDNHPDIPPVESGCVRGNLLLAAWHLQVSPDGHGCTLQSFVQTDLKGWIPNSVLLAISQNIPSSIVGMRDYLVQHGAPPCIKEMESGKVSSVEYNPISKEWIAKYVGRNTVMRIGLDTKKWAALGADVMIHPLPESYGLSHHAEHVKVLQVRHKENTTVQVNIKAVNNHGTLSVNGEVVEQLKKNDKPISTMHYTTMMDTMQGAFLTVDRMAKEPSDLWTLVSKKAGCVSEKRLVGEVSELAPVFRTSLVIEGYSMEEVLAVINNPSCRKVWDDMYESEHVLEHVNGAIVCRITLRGYFPIKARDVFTITNVQGTRTNSLSHVSRSVVLPAQPHANPLANLYLNGWHLKAIDPYQTVSNHPIPSTHVTHVLVLEFGGSVPSSVCQMVVSGMTKYVTTVKDYLERHGVPPYVVKPDTPMVTFVQEQFDHASKEFHMSFTAECQPSEPFEPISLFEVIIDRNCYPKSYSISTSHHDMLSISILDLPLTPAYLDKKDVVYGKHMVRVFLNAPVQHNTTFKMEIYDAKDIWSTKIFVNGSSKQVMPAKRGSYSTLEALGGHDRMRTKSFTGQERASRPPSLAAETLEPLLNVASATASRQASTSASLLAREILKKTSMSLHPVEKHTIPLPSILEPTASVEQELFATEQPIQPKTPTPEPAVNARFVFTGIVYAIVFFLLGVLLKLVLVEWTSDTVPFTTQHDGWLVRVFHIFGWDIVIGAVRPA